MKIQTIFRSITVFMALVIVFPVILAAQSPFQEYYDADDFFGCTSIQVGKLASTDGSVITSHSCDGNYRMWLDIVPRQKHEPGTMHKVYWGTLHNETAWDLRGLTLKGEIPEVEETYRYMNVAYPCMNEKQLAIGETTIGGRPDLYNDEGLFLIEELQRLALQRCDNARDAVKLMGDMATKYGFGDRGECLTVADPKEIWHFEIFGAGPIEPGAVWAAVRIPDDEIGVSANIPRISTLDLDDPDHYMASENVFSLAEEMGWWDSKSGKPFRFWEAYSGRKPYSIRDFFILSTLAPSLNLNMEMEELPFSVKPDRKMSIRDILAYYRQTYEGTPYSMVQNLKVPRKSVRNSKYLEKFDEDEEMVTSPIVHNFMSRDMMALLNALKPGTVERQRTISIAACSYSQIIQCRDWLPDDIGCVAYFSFDNPGQSPRMPIFSGTLELPKSFKIGAQHRFRTDSAGWYFRRANRLATVRWGTLRDDIETAVMEFEDRLFEELPMIEKKYMELYNNSTNGNGKNKGQEYLTQYTNDFARATMNKWWELGDHFWTVLARGF